MEASAGELRKTLKAAAGVWQGERLEQLEETIHTNTRNLDKAYMGMVDMHTEVQEASRR